MNKIVAINRKDGVPEVPAPFVADGRPTWVAVLNPEQFKNIEKVIKNPSKKFKNEIKSVFINGECVFGDPTTDSDPYSDK